MRSDWTALTIADLVLAGEATIQTGPFGSQLHSYDYVSEGAAVIPTEAIGRGRILDIVVPKVNASKAEELSRHRLKVGDILFARRGAQATGLSAIVDQSFEGAICGTGALLLRIQSDRVDPNYLAKFLSSETAYVWLRSHAVGAVMPNLNTSIIKALPIVLPSISVQRNLAKFLDALDDRVTLLRDTNSTLDAMAKALFKSWFVDFDPVRAKMDGLIPEGMNEATAAMFPPSLAASELGPIPNGWRIAKLHNATSAVFSGGTPDTRRPDFWDGDIPWFSSGETRNLVIVDTEKRITKEGVDGSSTRPVHPGDILIASAGQGHTRGQTSYCGIDCYINQSVVALRAGELCKPSWLFFNLARRYEEMRNLSDSHSSRGSLTTKLLNQMPVVLPPLDIIDAFDDVASTLLSSILSNVKQAQSLSELRDTLLPRLISGQVTLPDLENQIEAIAA
jgi:type I restriction enzyme S subunit